jgi:hypothetical protein
MGPFVGLEANVGYVVFKGGLPPPTVSMMVAVADQAEHPRGEPKNNA